jgi:hypothetical protein
LKDDSKTSRYIQRKMVSLLRALKNLTPLHKFSKREPKTPPKQIHKNSTSDDVPKPLTFSQKLLKKLTKKKKAINDTPMKIYDDHLQMPETPAIKFETVAHRSPGASPKSMPRRSLLSPSLSVIERPSLSRVSRKLSSLFESETSGKCLDTLDLLQSPPRIAKRYSAFVNESDVELDHDTAYTVTFANQHRVLSLIDGNKVMLMSPIRNRSNSTHQEWIVTDEGCVQSCQDPNLVLEIRNSVVQCSHRVPLKEEMDENDDIVSQQFDIVYVDTNKSTAEKYIRLKKNRKMILGESRRIENKLVLHVLNHDNAKNHKWLFRKVK